MLCSHEPCTCAVAEDTATCAPSCADSDQVIDTCGCGHDGCEAAPIVDDRDVDIDAFDPHTVGESVKAPFTKPTT